MSGRKCWTTTTQYFRGNWPSRNLPDDRNIENSIVIVASRRRRHRPVDIRLLSTVSDPLGVFQLPRPVFPWPSHLGLGPRWALLDVGRGGGLRRDDRSRNSFQGWGPSEDEPFNVVSANSLYCVSPSTIDWANYSRHTIQKDGFFIRTDWFSERIRDIIQEHFAESGPSVLARWQPRGGESRLRLPSVKLFNGEKTPPAVIHPFRRSYGFKGRGSVLEVAVVFGNTSQAHPISGDRAYARAWRL